MQKKRVIRKLKVDPYGHEELLPRSTFRREDAVFVAEASVWYESIGARESYWVQSNASGKSWSLWCRSSEMPDEEFCCAVIPGALYKGESTAEKTLRMLKALCFSRAPYAVSLASFTKDGLLSRECLDALAADYHKALEPPQVQEGAEVEHGELFHESGKLKYRGEYCDGLAHGKGTGFWKNGKPWCEGHFYHNQPHGECKVYFPDGRLRHEGMFSEGYPRGWGREYYDNGQLWFEGIFDTQTIRYGWGARKYVRGKLYSDTGRLKHDGDFVSDGWVSKPVKQSTKS